MHSARVLRRNTAMRPCPNCGQDVASDSDRFCPHCGYLLPRPATVGNGAPSPQPAYQPRAEPAPPALIRSQQPGGRSAAGPEGGEAGAVVDLPPEPAGAPPRLPPAVPRPALQRQRPGGEGERPAGSASSTLFSPGSVNLGRCS